MTTNTLLMGDQVSGPEPARRRPAADVSRKFSRLARKDTTPELRIRRHLHALGLRYRVDHRIDGLPRKRVDIVFPRRKIAVFVDGCFWHGCPDHYVQPRANAEWWRWKLDGNRERDAATDARLRELGWTVLRFWEHQDSACVASEIRQVWQGTIR